MALQVRRGTNAERLGITPAEGELIYTVDTKQLYVGDGTTAGGNASIAGTIDSLLADSSPQLGGTLDLNNNDITGTGNINITGTINATGNINLGDGAGGDIITLGGDIAGDLVPDVSDTRNIGSQTRQWNEAWIGQLNVNSQVSAERFEGDLIARDSTLVFNSQTGALAAEQLTGTFTGNVVGNVTGNVVGNTTGYHTGDVSGSLFADDSTIIVDGILNKVSTNDLTTTNLIATSAGAGITFNTPGDASRLLFSRSSATALATNEPVGRLLFQQVENNVASVINTISVTEDQLAIIPAPAGTVDFNNYFKVYNNGSVAISMGAGEIGNAPGATLEVGGAIKPGVYADDAARDAAITSPIAGMMVFNTTGTKFQGYTGSAWVDLN